MKTWFITGASSGLGLGIARAALLSGDFAAVASRDASRLKRLREEFGTRVLPVSLDVTDARGRKAAVEYALSAFGRVDVLVNNAGVGHFGSVEDSQAEDVRALFETDFFGAAGMIREVLPHMRENRSGAIVNISSMGVMLESMSGNGYYAAAKAALEALSSSLRNEVSPLGIRVMVVEPGAFRTEFRNAALMSARPEAPDYENTAGASGAYLKDHPYNQPGDPAKAGRAICAALEMKDPPKVLVLGKGMVEAAEKTLSGRIAEIKKWKRLSDSTDFS